MSRPFVKIAAGLAAVALPLSAVTAVAGAAGYFQFGNRRWFVRSDLQPLRFFARRPFAGMCAAGNPERVRIAVSGEPFLGGERIATAATDGQ